jgi:hypothetical protein
MRILAIYIFDRNVSCIKMEYIDLISCSIFAYCHISGVCVTNKKGMDFVIEFIEPLI